MPICPRCGHEISPDAEFCGYCGQRLAPAGAEPEAAPEQPPARSRSRAWLFVVGCLVFLCGLLAAAACIVFFLFPSLLVLPEIFGGPSGGQPEATSTPTVVAGLTPAVRTPTGPTPTPPPAGATRAATPVGTPASTIRLGNETFAVNEVVMAEDFADTRRGWKVQRTGDIQMYVQDGEYYIQASGSDIGDNSVVNVPGTPIPSDFALLVDARNTAPARRNFYGLTYGDATRGVYYLFEISDEGFFRIRYATRAGDGTWNWETRPDWQPTGALKAQGQRNNLAVVRRKSVVAFYVNGQKLHSLEDPRGVVPPAQVGVSAGAWDQPTGYAFDNLTLATLR